jgi:hypothetical protein
MKLIFSMIFLILLTTILYTNTQIMVEEETNKQKKLKVVLEFSIRQDMQLIRESIFGEPPQFAIWLEDLETNKLKTVFVTYRSGSGDWAGKTECPAALPRWFEVFEVEFDYPGYPDLLFTVPDAITGATPQIESIRSSIQVELESRWIYWVEMNLSGDFNDYYKDHDMKKRKVDIDLSGQPALIWRGEIHAIPGEINLPVLYGQSLPYDPNQNTIQPVSPNVTTAKSVFKKIEAHVK